MMLHEDRYSFLAILNQIHDASGVRLDILEKDYYVSLLLRELAEKQKVLPAYFKGGTALYKAQKSIRRFSEDIDLTVSVEYGSDAAAVKAALLEIIAAQEGTLDAATPGAADPFVALLALKDSSVDFVVRVWVKREDYWNVFFSLNESVYTLLPSKYGIQFPFPQMDVHIQS